MCGSNSKCRCYISRYPKPPRADKRSSSHCISLDFISCHSSISRAYIHSLATISEEHKHLVVGGEVNLWCELSDGVSLDSMLWPRAAAAAEALWRGKGEVGEGATRRLAEMRERLVKRDIQAGVVQMEWALQNSHECVL